MASSDEVQDHLEAVDDCLEYISETLNFSKEDLQITEKVMDEKKATLEETKISIAANSRTVEALKRTLEAVKLSLGNEFEAVDEVENHLKSMNISAKSEQNGEKSLEDEPNNVHADEENNVPSLFFINFEKDRQGSEKAAEVSEEFAYAEMHSYKTQTEPINFGKTLEDEKTDLKNWSTETKLDTNEEILTINKTDLINEENKLSKEYEMEKEKHVQHKEKQTHTEECDILEEKTFLSEEERALEEYELARFLVGLNETPENIEFANEELFIPKNVSGEIKEFQLTEEKSERAKEAPQLNGQMELADEQSVRPKENGFEDFEPEKEESEQINEISQLTKQFELFMEEYEQTKEMSQLNDEFELAKEQSVTNEDNSGLTKDFNFTEEKYEPPKEKHELTDDLKNVKEHSVHPNEKHSTELEQSEKDSIQNEHYSGIDAQCELVKEKPLVLIVQPKDKLDGSNEFELTWEKYMQPKENHPEEFEMADTQFVQLTYQTEVIKEAFKLAREKSARTKETSKTAKKSKMEVENVSQPKKIFRVARESELDDGIFVRPKGKPRVSKKYEMAKGKSGGSKESSEDIVCDQDQTLTTKEAFELARDKSVRPKEKRQEVLERFQKRSVRPTDQSKETKALQFARDASVRPKEKPLMEEVDRADNEPCSKDSSGTDQNVDKKVTCDCKFIGMDNPMNAMLFSEQLIEYVLNKLGYSWPCHEGARNLPIKCVSTRFSDVIGETIIAIIDSNIDKIAESYRQLIEKNVHRIDSFRIEVCVTATFFFAAGYNHVHYLVYAAQLAGLSAFYFASGNPVIAEASAQVLAYIINYYIYQLSFCPGSDWFNLHLHAQILRKQIQNGTIRFCKPPECNP